MQKTDLIILGSGIIAAMFETGIRITNQYEKNPAIDIPSHTLWGAFAYGMSKAFWPKHPLAASNIMILAWEVGEVMIEQVMTQPPWHSDTSLPDTMGDILFHNAGSLIMHGILR